MNLELCNITILIRITVLLQHVLEHGKPHERTAIIEKLIGQIVQMSQQKFASNVIEKCLAFGNPVERQILIGEMLGSTSTRESEPLEVCVLSSFSFAKLLSETGQILFTLLKLCALSL